MWSTWACKDLTNKWETRWVAIIVFQIDCIVFYLQTHLSMNDCLTLFRVSLQTWRSLPFQHVKVFQRFPCIRAIVAKSVHGWDFISSWCFIVSRKSLVSFHCHWNNPGKNVFLHFEVYKSAHKYCPFSLFVLAL